MSALVAVAAMPAVAQEAAVRTFVQQTKRLENATHRIAWNLSNFATSGIRPDAGGEVPVAAVQRLLGVAVTGNNSENLCKHLRTITNSSVSVANAITSVMDTTRTNLLTNAAFTAAVAPLPDQLLALANFLYGHYRTFVNGEASEFVALEDVQYQSDEVSELPSFFERIAAHTEEGGKAFAALVDQIVDTKNHELIDSTRALYSVVNGLATALAQLKRVVSSSRLLDQYADGLDAAAAEAMARIDVAASAMAFDVVHDSCAAEFADIMAAVESVTSGITAQLGRISTFTDLPARTPDDEVFFRQCVQTMTAQMSGLTNNVDAIAQQIRTNKNCQMNANFIAQMRSVEVHARTLFHAIYEACSHAGFPVDEALLPSRAYHFGETPMVFIKIQQDLANLQNPMSLMLKLFETPEFYDEDIGLDLRDLNDQIALFAQTIASEDPDSLVPTLRAAGCSLCTHEEISIPLADALDNIQSALEELPIVNLDICCAPYFEPMRNIQSCWFAVARGLKAFVEDSGSYVWARHPHWKRLILSIDGFLQRGITAETIRRDTSADAAYCQAFRLQSYLEDLSAGASAMRDAVDAVTAETGVSVFAGNRIYQNQNRGCASIARFLQNISKAVSSIGALFPTIESSFMESDYAIDPDLQQTLQQTLEHMAAMLQQFGVNLPTLSDLCPQCHLRTHPDPEFPSGLPLLSYDGSFPCDIKNQDHLDVYEAIRRAAETVRTGGDNMVIRLAVPLCCHQPALKLTDLHETLDRVAAAWKQIQDMGLDIPYLSLTGVASVANEAAEAAALLHEMALQFESMRAVAQAPLSSETNPCYLFEVRGALDAIISQAIGLHGVVQTLASEFGLNALWHAEPSYASADFCPAASQHLGGIVTALHGMASSMETFQRNLSLRDIVRYSEPLENAMECVQREAQLVCSEWQKLALAIEALTVHHCTKHVDCAKVTDALAECKGSVDSTLQIVRDVCCSYLARDAYLTAHYLNQVNHFIVTVHDRHIPDTLLTASLPTVDRMCPALAAWQEALVLLQQDIRLCNLHPTRPHCRAYFLTNHLQQLNGTLQDYLQIVETLLPLIPMDGSVEEVALAAPPAQFRCEQAQHFIAQCATGLTELAANLSALEGLLREVPPFYANHAEFARVIALAATVSDTFCEIIQFFETRADAPSEHLVACQGCSGDLIPLGTMAAARESLSHSFAELADITSKPGCCISLADAAISLHNSLLRAERYTYALSLENSIVLDGSAYDSFLQSAAAAVAAVKAVEDQLSRFAFLLLPDPGEGRCPKQNATPYVQNLSTAMLDAGTALGNLFGYFTTIPGEDIALENALHVNRFVAACACLSEAVDRMVGVTADWEQDLRTIITCIQKPVTRPYRPAMVHAFEELYTSLQGIQSSMHQVADQYTAQAPCPYCDEEGFRQNIQERLDQLQHSTGRLIENFGQDEPSALVGSLRRYCCSEPNVLLQAMAEKMLCIHSLVTNMCENEWLWDVTFSSAIAHYVTPIQSTFVKWEEALLRYGSAMTHQPLTRLPNGTLFAGEPVAIIGRPEICELGAHLDELREVMVALADFQTALLSFANWSGTNTATPLIQTKVQIPHIMDDTQEAIDRMNQACQEMTSLQTRLLLEMQSRAIYASNPPLRQFILAFAHEPLDACLAPLQAPGLCPYCPRDFRFDFSRLGEALVRIEARFQQPTCCSILQTTLQTIAARSRRISVMDDEFLKAADPVLFDSSRVFDQVAVWADLLWASGQAFVQALDSASRNSPCVLHALGPAFETLLPYTEALANATELVLKDFVGLDWSGVDREDIMQGPCGNLDLLDFCEAMRKTVAVAERIENIVAGKSVIQYTQELMARAINMQAHLARTHSIFGGVVAARLAEFTPCYACRNSIASFPEQFNAIGEQVRLLQRAVNHTVDGIRNKCCSLMMQAISKCVIQLNRIHWCCSRYILVSPAFRSALHDLGGYCPLLDSLNGERMAQLRASVQALLTVCYVAEGDECLAYRHVPAIENIGTQIQDIADQFESVYTEYYRTVDIEPASAIPFSQYTCTSDVLEWLLMAVQQLVEDALDLKAEQAHGSVLSGMPINNALDALSAEMRGFADTFREAHAVAKESEDKFFGVCVRCARPGELLQTLAEQCQKIADSLAQVPAVSESCCRGFTLLTAECAAEVDCFAQQNAAFWAQVEHALLERRSMFVMEDDSVLQSVISFLRVILAPVGEVVGSFQGMNDLLSAADTDVQGHCFSSQCYPHTLAIRQTLLQLNALVESELTRNCPEYVQPDYYVEDLALNGCLEREHYVHKLVSGFNKVLATWCRAAELAEHNDVWCACLEFKELVQRLSERMEGLYTQIARWADNNRPIEVMVSNVDGGFDPKMVCHFCRRCPATEAVTEAWLLAQPISAWKGALQTLADSGTTPEALALLALAELLRQVQQTRCFLQIFASAPQFVRFVAANPAAQWWGQLASSVEDFAPDFAILYHNQNASIFSETRLFADTYSALNGHFTALLRVLRAMLNQYEIPFDEVHSPTLSVPASFQRYSMQDLLAALLGAFEELSGAWDTTCGAVQTYAPDACRESLANAITPVQAALKAVYHNLPSNDLFLTPWWVAPVARTGSEMAPQSQAQKILERMIHRVELLLHSVWSRNCCDAQAECVAALVHYLEQTVPVTGAFAGLPVEEAPGLLQRFEGFLQDAALQLRTIGLAVQGMLLRTDGSRCASADVVELVRPMGLLYLQFLQGWAAEVGQAVSVPPAWSDLSADSRNDCAFLPELYQRAAVAVQGLLPAVIDLAVRCQGVSPARLDLQSLPLSLEKLADSLGNLVEEQRTALLSRPVQMAVCHACDTAALLNSLEGIEVDLRAAAVRLHGQLQSFFAQHALDAGTENLLDYRVMLQEFDQTPERPMAAFIPNSRRTIEDLDRTTDAATEAVCASASRFSRDFGPRG